MSKFDFTARELLSLPRDFPYGLEKSSYKIKFDDGTIVETKTGLIWLDRFIWELYKRYPETPIIADATTSSIIGNDFYNGGTHSASIEATQKHIIEYNNLTSYRKKESLAKDCMWITNLILNELTQMSSQYVSMVDAIDCVEAINDPKIIEIISRIENTPDSVDKGNQELIQYAKHGGSDNVFFRTNRCGSSSDSQFVQLIGVRGFVTDLDRTVFTQAILTGFMRGMGTLYNMMAESRTAAKALTAAGASIQKSEYASRRFQQLTMFVETAIDTDCGSTKYTKMYLTEKYLANVEGIYYVTEDDPTLRCFKGDEKHLLNKVVYIRSAWNCTLENPHHVCVKCAGEVFNNFRENTNLGYLCSAYLMEKVTQRILSFKHVVKSISSSILKVEGRARKYFKGNKNNELECRDDMDLTDLYIIINARELDRLTEALGARRQDINVAKIGTVKKIGIVSEDGKIKEDMALSSGDRQANITFEFLEHIKDSEFQVSDKGRYIIPLKGWDINKPMFEVPLKEADVALFVSEVEKLVEGTSDRTDSLDNHYFKLVDKILENSKCNLSTLQILNYAISVQNPQDGNYRLGRGSTYDGFSTKDLIFKNRSLAPFLIGGDQSRMILSSPEEIFSKKNRQRSPLDVLYIPQQVIHGRRK